MTSIALLPVSSYMKVITENLFLHCIQAHKLEETINIPAQKIHWAKIKLLSIPVPIHIREPPTINVPWYKII